MNYNMYPNMQNQDSGCKKRIIKVNGRGLVEAAPDIAIIVAGVITKDMDAQTAQKQNDAITKKVIAALIQMGISADDIKTESYTIFPDYDYQDGKQILTGYVATHLLEIKVRDLNKVGQVINTATANGANQISRVQFTVEDSASYYNRALRLAVKDAASKADAIARTMKVSLIPVPCTVTEQSTSFTPMAEQSAMKLGAFDSVMPGKIEITAAIEAEFMYLT